MSSHKKLCFILLAMSLPVLTASAQWVTQAVHLRAGWNSVFLRVDPYPNRCEIQFKGLPIESVWTFDPRFSSVQFIQNPSELTPEIPEWRSYFPPNRPKALKTNLFILRAGRCYMIKVSEDATWTVKGRPLLMDQEWKPDAYNLVGFYVDPQNPPTYANWFSTSAAHRPLEVWSLGDDGTWQRIPDPASTLIIPGQAYWVFCRGPSDYQGPVRISLGAARQLEYPRLVVEHAMQFKHEGSGERQIFVDEIPSEVPPAFVPEFPSIHLHPLAGDVPLAYRSTSAGGPSRFTYVGLPSTINFPATERAAKQIKIAVQRNRMPPSSDRDARYQSILVIKDGAGFRRMVGVISEGIPPASSSVASKGGTRLTSGVQAASSARSFAGLWMGYVTVNRVSEPNIDPPVLTETPSEFTFRVIMHVDSQDPPKVRLLNQAALLWRNGTTKLDPSGQEVVDEPGRYILMTPTAPQSLLNEIGTTVVPATLRDGRPFANRISTAMFSLRDADGNPEEPVMTLNGDLFTPGSTLEVDLVVEDTDPVNPFHHQFHPMHRYPKEGDILTAANLWIITRQLKFTFTEQQPDHFVQAGWGDTQVGGVYQEVIEGLRRYPIALEGIYRLELLFEIPVLNDAVY